MNRIQSVEQEDLPSPVRRSSLKVWLISQLEAQKQEALATDSGRQFVGEDKCGSKVVSDFLLMFLIHFSNGPTCRSISKKTQTDVLQS